MEYNIWHIEMYIGDVPCDGSEECNYINDVVFDKCFNRRNIIDMMMKLYESVYTVVEVWCCELLLDNK